MGRTYIVQYHPIPLRDWLHERQWFVRTSLGLIIAMLVAAIVVPTVSMVRTAIADYTEPAAIGAEVISTTEMPREWRWSVKPITFDHMYRHSEPKAVLDYTRDLSRIYSGSSSE